MLLLDMAYRLLREFRQAFTHLDTPPFSNRRHPGSDIAPATLGPGSQPNQTASPQSEAVSGRVSLDRAERISHERSVTA